MPRLALRAVVALSLAASAVADDKTLETLTVSANRVEQNTQSLNSLSVISRDAIETVSHTHINELLNRAPGVWISRGNGQEHLTAIRSGVLTGPGSCGAFYMAEDGIPLRAPGFCNVNQLFDANTEQAARIEVIRGPGNAVHGSNALNGVINVITRAPTEEPETRISAEGGPHDYSRLKLDHSQGNATHRFGISANGAHDGGYKDDSGFDQQKMTLRYDYSGDAWSNQNVLTATNLNQETAGFVLGLDAYKDDALKKSNPNPEAYRDTRSARFYSRWEHAGKNDTQFVVTPYLRYTEMDFLQHFLPGTPLEQNGQKSAGLQTVFVSPGGDNLRLHNGFDIDYTEGYLRQSQTRAGFAVFPTGKHYDYDVDAINAAWFLGGEWAPSTSREVTAGIRYERQRYSYKNRMIDGNTDENGNLCAINTNNPTGACRYSRPTDGTDTFNNWSGYIGARQDLSDTIALVVHASRGFRAPQTTELYRLQSTQLNTRLDSEEVRNYEVGLRGEWSRLNANLTAYRLEKDNIILQNDIRETFSGGETLRRGLELSLSWSILDTLTLATQGSYAKSQYDNDVLGVKGNEVNGAPRRMASAQLRWQPLRGTTAELEWVHIGEHFLDVGNDARYPGHNLMHLRLQQAVNKTFTLSVRVTNLTDEDYAERADFGGVPADFRYFIGEPRSAYVGVSASF